jgi:signal transduction histidine kinase/response regulator of citrate/malate metabolism
MERKQPINVKKLPAYSFKQKGMTEAIGFLEEINMLANIGGWEMDLDKGELFWTAGTKRIQDVPEDYEPEFNKSLLFYKAGENRERLQRLVRRAIKEGIPFDEEFEMITATGREIWVRSIGHPEHIDKRCVRLFGSVQDITQTKKLMLKNLELTKLYDAVVQLSGKLIQAEVVEMKAAIENALKTLSELSDADRVIIFEVNPQDNLLSITHEWRAHDIKCEKIKFQNLECSTFPFWQQLLEDKNYIYFRTSDSEESENDSKRKILEKLMTNSLVAIPMFSGGSMIGFAGFMTQNANKIWDEQTISLLKIAVDVIAGGLSRMSYENSLIRAKQEAEAENLAKSEFLLNMGHEIKTRLHEILGFSELVLTATKEEQSRQRLQLVAKSGTALLGLFGDLLELSKIEVSQETHQEPTNIKDLVEEIKQVFLPIAEKQKISISTKIPGSLPLFVLDQRRLKHALINIVGNAVKFTPKEHGNVTISIFITKVKETSELCNLTILTEDTGIGIREGMKKQIQDFFDRPGTLFTKGSGNVGLGLYILKRLIGIMQGTVKVESELSKGSKFTIQLNNIEALYRKPTIENETPPPFDISFKGQKIMMFEDQIPHYIIAQTLLENTNLQLFHARSGEEGLKVVQTIRPDLILMDIHMPPGMNGFEAARILRENPSTEHIPIIAYTTNVFDSQMERDRYLFNELLEKVSVTRTKLVDVLVKYLEHSSVTTAPVDEEQESNNVVEEDMQFLKEIVDSYKNRINQLIGILDITEIDNLIEDLENQNIQIASPKLSKYIENLKEANYNFDFDQLNYLFKSFEQLLTGKNI